VIAGDTQQPGQDAGPTRLIAGRVLDDRDEHVLDDVLRERPGAAHVQREAVDVGSTSPVQQCERVPVAARDPRDQVFVPPWLEIGHQTTGLDARI
jgi:hypothetical protein